MGMNINSNKGGRGKRAYKPLSEINITPFVDVMLVLLIIFMVAAPMLSMGVPVDLPKVQASPIDSNTKDEPLVISIDKTGQVFLQKNPVDEKELLDKLSTLAQANSDLRLFIKGDQNIRYGRVMSVMNIVLKGGYNKVSLVTEMPQENPDDHS